MRKIILTVESTVSGQQGIAAALEAAGYEVFQSPSGIVALEILRMLVVDLVIAEVNLPQMDGIEFTRQMRAQPYLQRMPVVLLASDRGDKDEALARLTGATTWLRKSAGGNQLMATVGGIFAEQDQSPHVHMHEFYLPPAQMAGAM